MNTISSSTPEQRLAIYLNDHLAGATTGVELARRLRASNEGDAEMAEPLARVCAEIEADRETLEELMRRLGIRRSVVKPAAAWLGEKLGRLKPNGQLHGYSPLSRLVELEILHIGITGKRRLWEALGHSLGKSVAGFDFDRLAERAAGQRETIGELHLKAAKRALT